MFFEEGAFNMYSVGKFLPMILDENASRPDFFWLATHTAWYTKS